MTIAAMYICPIRGLATLEPPEPGRLGEASRAARAFGIERLFLPILEEPLAGHARARIRYLDGLIGAMDRADEAGMEVGLIAPARKVLGMNFVAPFLVKAVRYQEAPPVFVEGKVRHLRPFAWWGDPSLIQRRIEIFREILSAVNGHPSLSSWVILDRALEWPRPSLEAADLVIQSFAAEIRERNEELPVHLGLGWGELLEPAMVHRLVGHVDGLYFSGMDSLSEVLPRPKKMDIEIRLTAFLATLAYWIFEKAICPEIGYASRIQADDLEEIEEASKILVLHNIASLVWMNLVSPDPPLASHPLWSMEPELKNIGVLDRGLELKAEAEVLLDVFKNREIGGTEPDFIDINEEAYVSDPKSQFLRLWECFQEMY
jgi:hypothetical protein